MTNQSPKKTSRTVAILVIIVLILIILGVYSHYKHQPNTVPTPENSVPSQPPTTPSSSSLLSPPKAINSFILTDDLGKDFTDENLKGHWTLMFFGFTHCGDVCPTTLSALNETIQILQKTLPVQAIPQVVMVSVDPDRDTTEVLHSYVKNFNADFIGARADELMLNKLSKDLGMYYQKVPQDNTHYTMNHSAGLYLFNPNGEWAAIFTYPHEADKLAKSYETIVNTNL